MPLALTRPELFGWFGAVSSSHWLASAAGMRQLERGGNAFDAAVTAGFVLQTVSPHLNGPAGDVAMLVFDRADGTPRALCGQGPTPAAMTIDRLTALGLDFVPGTGLLPAVVPGAFDAWMLLLAEKGSMTLRQVLQPAIDYAHRGIPVDARLHATLTAAQAIFRDHWPQSLALFSESGSVPAIGATMANPTLAEVWSRLIMEAEAAGGDRVRQIEAARHAWSDGFVADEIDRFCQTAEAMDVSGRKHAALLRGTDLAGWRAHFEAPTMLDYGEHRIAKCGPWTQGPVLLQTLALAGAAEMAALDPVGPEFVHLVTEAMKLAYADREVYYGDDRAVSVPIEHLLSPAYARERRAAIGPEANNGWRPGKIDGFGSVVDFEAARRRVRDTGVLAAYGGGEPTVQSIAQGGYAASVVGDTCHVDVVDADGNMVSATPSGGWLQSSPAIPALGFPLGTRAQMMWLDPHSPSGVAPGRRPRSTLSPTLVLDAAGTARLACGTPGGDQQDQWQTLFLIRHLVHGQSMQEAIEAPAFHSEHWPNSFYPRHAQPGRLVMEGRFDPKTVAELRKRGHDVVVGDDWSEGRMTAVSRQSDGSIRAAANPRGSQGYAVGR